MTTDWNDGQPIYRQIRERVIVMILDNVLIAGDSLPSVRAVAAESRVNHLTVLKAYQQLVDEGIVLFYEHDPYHECGTVKRTEKGGFQSGETFQLADL